MKHSKIITIKIPIALTILFSVIFLFSCTKTELVTQAEDTQNFSSRIGGDIVYKEGTNTVLGEKKKNPYTVANMNSAWQNIATRGMSTSLNAKVYASYLYVKFAPKNSDEYEILHEDTTLSFSDYPIESEIIQNGDYYHDPSLPDSIPTYQYTAVPINYKFPEGINYEVIDSLYIPESDPIFNYENGGTEDCFVDKLLNEAYILTGNFEDTIDVSNCQSNLMQRRYTPGGRIRVFDTRLQQWIGMEGVRVQARRWFIWYNGFPDFNGNYRMLHSFKRPCNYSIWFARDRFSVRHNLVNTTFWINGPKTTGDWNYDLNDSYQRFAGHVFRGGYRYHNKDIGGLQRPFRWLRKRTVYVAVDGTGDESGINWIVLPIIKVWRNQTDKSEYLSDEIFSTTCHETGHTSHVIRMNAGPIQYWQVSRQLQESWAIGIEWFLTHIEYKDRGVSNYGESNYHPFPAPQYPNDQAYQYWNNGVSSRNTNLYINIVDKVNEFNQFYQGWGLGTTNDQVAGYTIPFIEQNLIRHIYGLGSLSDELMNNKPPGVTDAQIRLLISYY